MDFLWAITRHCTMFAAHKKFDKDGSMRGICDDKQTRVKTVITVYALVANKV